MDEFAHSMEKLFEDAPEWLANIEKIKRKQGIINSFYKNIYTFWITILTYLIYKLLSDSIEQCILATQEKIFENENRLEKLKSLQNGVTEDINNDLKKIQEQIIDVGFI